MIHPRAAFALAGVFALVATSLVPFASAQTAPFDPLRLLGVGDLLVDAEGHVAGAHVQATLDEATGALGGFGVGGHALFRSVAVDGFAGTQKLQGVGSPQLTLAGSNADLTLLDDVHAALRIEASRATRAAFDLAPGVQAAARSAGVIDLQAPDGSWLGSIIAAGADGPASLGDSLSATPNGIVATLQPGSDLLFLAAPASDAAAPMARALVEAAAEGDLASSFVTDFHGNAVASTQLDAARSIVARTTQEANGVQTLVASPDASPAILSYDLAYESLPAPSADDVAVYVDGELAAHAESPQDVRDLADQGVASYFATVQDGRAQILASTTDFLGAAQHRVTVAASRALTEAQAQAEIDGATGVLGDLQLHPNGKLTGTFLSGDLEQGDALLASFTALPQRAEVFGAVTVDGSSPGSIMTLDPQHLRVAGSKADLTLVDDAYSTLLLDAKQPASATFALAPGVDARSVLSDLVQLRTDAGADAGTLVALDGGSLRVDGASVQAQLDNGTRLVYRAPGAAAFASEEAVTEALAAGHVGAQLLAGNDADGVATGAVEYLRGTLSSVAAPAPGQLEIQYSSPLQGAEAFVLDTRGAAALAARGPGDVRVLVDGAPAIPVANAETALAMGAQPRAFVESSADGALRVVVNVAKAAGQTAHVLVESDLASDSGSASGAQLGGFRLFADGTAVGRFAEAHADRAAGAVSHYALVGRAGDVFSSLAAGSSPFQADGLADGGASLVLENAQSRLAFADAASPTLLVQATQATDAAFQLGSGLRTDDVASNVLAVKDGANETIGTLVLCGAGDLLAEGSHVTAHLPAGSSVLFEADAGLRGELTSAQRQLLDEALATGALAGQVVVQTQPATPAPGPLAASSTDAVEAQPGDVTTSLVQSLGDVQMIAAATQDRVQVTLSSATAAGRAVAITLDANTVPSLATGDAQLLLDGAPMRPAASLADVLQPGAAAKYFVLAGDAGDQVLVSVPHFSVHTVTIQSRSSGGGPAASPYLYACAVFLGLLAAGEAALLIRNARRKA